MAKSFKLPKKIAGVKIPKALRKPGKSLTAFLESPIGRQAAAAALTAMAGVLAGTSKPVQETVGDAGQAAGKAAGNAGRAVANTSSAASGLMRDMAEVAVGVVADAARELVTSNVGGKSSGKRSGGSAGKH